MKYFSSELLSNAATVLGLVAAIFLALTETLPIGLTLASLAAAAFVASLVVRRKERKRVRTALEEIRADLSPDRVLDATARYLALGGTEGGWRLSLYLLDVHAEEWVLRARASSNELFADHRDMPSFAPGVGVLRSCLAGSDRPLGRFDEMPPLPPVEDAGWFTTLETWGVTPGVAAQLRMKSRSYCGAVFKVGRSDGHQLTLGIVAESEQPDGIDLRTLEAGLTRPFFESLAEIVQLNGALDSLEALPTNS